MKFSTFITLIASTTIFFATPTLALAATYYVSPAGSDNNNGSENTPYKTFNKAQTSAASGDTIIVKAGTYTTPINVTKSNLNIIGQNAVIDATGYHKAIEINGNNIVMDGFEAKHSNSHIVYITGKNITFKNAYIHDGIYENRKSDGYAKNSAWGSGLSIKQDDNGPNEAIRIAENVLIDNVRIEKVYGEGLDMYGVRNVTITNTSIVDAFSYGYYIDNSHDITIDGNFAHCTGDARFDREGKRMKSYGMGIERLEDWVPNANWGARLYNIKIINNISYGCRNISMWGSEQPSGTANNGLRDALIAHNSIFSIPGGQVAIWIEALPANSNIKIQNNLTQTGIGTGAGISLAGNVTGVNFTTSNPTPENIKPENGKDKGVVTEVLKDFAGNARDNKPDAGAWEIGGIPGASSSPSPSLSPSPSPTLKTGDANGDNLVDGVDYVIWLNNYNKTISGGSSVGDFDNNGKVDGVDYVLWLNNYGK